MKKQISESGVEIDFTSWSGSKAAPSLFDELCRVLCSSVIVSGQSVDRWTQGKGLLFSGKLESVMQVKAADAAYASISPSPVIIFESRTKNLRYANSLAPDIRHGNIDLEVRMKGGSAFIEFKRYMNFGSVRRDVARLANLLEAVRATGETAVGIMVGPSYGRQESGWSTEKFTRSYRDKFVAGAPNLDTYLYVSKPYRLSEPVAYGKNEVEQFQAIAVLMSEP